MKIRDNVLIVSGNRESPLETKDLTCHIGERAFGQFERRVRLPQAADTEKIEANMEHGVLSVKIAKKAEKKAKSIAIR